MNYKTPNVDFHSHILPRADHGCKCSSESKLQLAMIRDAGTDIVVATPHFYPHVHNVDDFIHNVNSAVARLEKLGIENAPRLCIGAEVLLCEKMNKLEGLSQLCIRGTNILLLELPNEMHTGHYKTVQALIDNGYTVVLAHIDRYLKSNSEYIYTFLDMGALAQINPAALSAFGPKKKIASILENSSSIVAIGSDLHGSKQGSLKGFLKLKSRLGAHYDKISERCAELLKDAQIIDLSKKD